MGGPRAPAAQKCLLSAIHRLKLCARVQVRAFYRGLSAPLLGGAAETAVNYAVYVHMLRSLRVRTPASISVDTLGARAPRTPPLAGRCQGAAGRRPRRRRTSAKCPGTLMLPPVRGTHVRL